MSGSIHQAEELVRHVADVAACRIEAEPDGTVVAVWVTTFGERAPADVRADVVVVLATELGLDVLEDQVRVTVEPPQVLTPEPEVEVEVEQEPEVEMELEPLETASRPRLIAVRSSFDDERSMAEVEIGLGSDTAFGQAEVRGAAPAPELVALATLDALEKLCGGRVTLRLVATRRTSVGDHDIVNVVVQESRGREARTHVGAARVGDDLPRALAYAALVALNRRFGRLLTLPPRVYRIE
jgi:hypothetical protein